MGERISGGGLFFFTQDGKQFQVELKDCSNMNLSSVYDEIHAAQYGTLLTGRHISFSCEAGEVHLTYIPENKEKECTPEELLNVLNGG